MIEENEDLLEVDIRKTLKEYLLTVSFSVKTGCLGILGPSGCGKSMTLKSIAGITDPDSGRICLQKKGEDGTLLTQDFFDSNKKVNLPPRKRNVGYLFQNYALFPNMTVEENIMAGFMNRKTEAYPGNRRKRGQEMMERFRLHGLENRYPGQLSGGQQQRVALARLLAYEPQVLLLDEPFSAMDAYLKEELRLALFNVLESCGKPAILVTHDRDEAYQLCGHLLLMSRGKVLASGETRKLFQNPVTCQAARVTGCKNISRIRPLGPYRVLALDWGGLIFTTEKPVTEEIGAIGIRAHDFMALSQPEAEELSGREDANLIPVTNPRISEMPFEWYLTLENGLWWKREKTIYSHDAAKIIPPWLRVEPGAILLLKDDR